MKTVIVPNTLRDAINAKLDDAFAACPEAAKDRDALYYRLLAYFDEHGELPDFTLTVSCVICGTRTPITGTKRCDRCWELERRIIADPELAKKILLQINS